MHSPISSSACQKLIVGQSPAIEQVRSLAQQIAPWPIPVLIEGPTGAGKELVAQAIHLMSGRRGRLVSLNMCAVPETLFEAMLFGHAKGAFTGAHHDSLGFVLEADGGTLFLDEISGLAPALQAKLLRVLDNRAVRQVGSTRDRASDFRLVSATNVGLAELVRASRFRHDFFYRLRGAVIAVPPLTERLEDIPLLASHFAFGAAEQMQLPKPPLNADAFRALEMHSWPGNVRELKQVIQFALVLAGGGTIGGREIRAAIGAPSWPVATKPKAGAVDTALVQLMERHQWVVASAAQELSVTPKTVYSRLQRAGIALPKRGNSVAVSRDVSEDALRNNIC